MPSKSIMIRQDVYDLLDGFRMEGESFTEVILRLLKERRIGECAGLWSSLDEVVVANIMIELDKLY